MKVILTTGGLTLPGEPGLGYYGHSLLLPDGGRLDFAGGAPGLICGLAAEYLALLHGLEFAVSHGATEVVACVASNPLYQQVLGRWSVRQPELMSLHLQVKSAARRFAKSSLRLVAATEADECYKLAIAHFIEKVEQGNRQRAAGIADSSVLERGEGLWDVSGAKGEVHHVDLGGRITEGTCSCMAYSIANACRPVRDRGLRIRCKHIEKVRRLVAVGQQTVPVH